MPGNGFTRAGMTVVMVLAVAGGCSAAAASPDHLVPFSIEDQFKQTHTEAEFTGQATALVWCDRASRKVSASWADSLEAAFARALPPAAWQVRIVAHTKGAPFFVKGKIRGSFSRDPDRWALLDWKGGIRATYDPPPDMITILLFGPEGGLLGRWSALEVDTDQVAEISRMAAAALKPRPPVPEPAQFPAALVAAARERTSHRVIYDGSYRRIAYPGGDVPDSLGVCCDVVIRAYRAVGIDLQRAVHEDMAAHFSAYPDRWGLSGPDANIDHRRVPNLQTFFTRHGVSLSATDDPADYRPGDLVTWLLPGGLPHIGIVVDGRSADGRRPLIVHNIGRGPRLEDVLFRFPITGHYRYDGSR